jgi:hypothetical protein
VSDNDVRPLGLAVGSAGVLATSFYQARPAALAATIFTGQRGLPLQSIGYVCCHILGEQTRVGEDYDRRSLPPHC